MITEVVIYLAILATSYPVAILLAWLCEDEIVKDRRYFIALSYFLVIIAIGIFIFHFDSVILLSVAYMLLLLAFLIKNPKLRKN